MRFEQARVVSLPALPGSFQRHFVVISDQGLLFQGAQPRAWDWLKSAGFQFRHTVEDGSIWRRRRWGRP